MKWNKTLLTISVLAFWGCNNTELDSIEINESKITEDVCLPRSMSDTMSVASVNTDLPSVRVTCLKNATSCTVKPISVRFYSPNAATVGAYANYPSSMIISPLFVTDDDKFQVIAVIEHGGCSHRHTLKISNGYGYTETIRSNSTIGTINYSGNIPLAHVGNSEQITVTLTD